MGVYHLFVWRLACYIHVPWIFLFPFLFCDVVVEMVSHSTFPLSSSMEHKSKFHKTYFLGKWADFRLINNFQNIKLWPLSFSRKVLDFCTNSISPIHSSLQGIVFILVSKCALEILLSSLPYLKLYVIYLNKSKWSSLK